MKTVVRAMAAPIWIEAIERAVAWRRVDGERAGPETTAPIALAVVEPIAGL